MTTQTTGLTFAKATKKAAKGRVALDGPSGSGKTYTALTMATALGDRIAVIDTEHGSASKYADLFEFDTLGLHRYSPQILIDALAAAGTAGYEVVVIDSLSHFWMGTDGMLEQVDKASRSSQERHGMSGWKAMRPVERQMVESLLAYPGHVICTLRVKSDWVEGERNGRKTMTKVGTKAEQREGLEYEFDLVGSMDLSNELTVVKSRCPALSGEIVSRPGRAFAETFKAWLDDGEQAGPSIHELLLGEIYAATDRTQLAGIWKQIGSAVKAGQLTEVQGSGLATAWKQRADEFAPEQTTEEPA